MPIDNVSSRGAHYILARQIKTTEWEWESALYLTYNKRVLGEGKRASIFSFILFLLLLNLTLAPSVSGENQTLSLKECYQLTLERSESLKITEQDMVFAEARYREALAALLPNLTLYSSQRFRNHRSSDDNSSGGSDSNNGFVGSRSDRFESWLQINQPIFAGFSGFLIKDAAKSEVRAATLEQTRAAQLLYNDVASLYYQITAYQSEVAEIEAMQKILRDRIKELKEWQKLGKSRESEVLAAGAELADLDASYEQVLGILAVSKELMAFLTGVQSEVLRLQGNQGVPTLLDLNHYLEIAKLRPDYSASDYRRDSFEKQLAATERERWPDISLQGNYLLEQSPDSSREWDVAFNMSLPIFDSGRISSKTAQMRTSLRSSELKRQELARVIERDVRSDYAQVQSIQREILKLNDFINLSKRNYELQEQDYKSGVVTNLDVLAALRQYREGRRRLISAESRLAVNIASLLVAAGEVP